MIRSATVTPNEYPQRIEVRTHVLAGDTDANDTAPSPHDYFDTALATCKSLTAHWYAKRNGIPLERVETEVERDNSQERTGTYKLRAVVKFFGALTDAQRVALYRAIGACPIAKLMTTSTVEIEQVEG